jgi:hypothetical protein
MYRRPKFLEILHEIRQEMARETDYEIDSFARMVRQNEVQDEIESEDIFESLVLEEVSKTKDQRPKTRK